MGGSSRAIGDFCRSSVGKKFIVALTGVALLLFVFGHLVGNLLIFVGRDAINSYGQFLHHFIHGWGVWGARIGLLVAIVLHIVMTIQLTRLNRASREQRYKNEATVQASRASRTMIVSGLLIIAFVIYHLLHFTITPGEADPGYFDSEYASATGEQRHDVYAMILTGFSSWLVSIVYILAIGLLCLHLSHGFASVFQTFGLRSSKSWPLIQNAGRAYAILIFVGNISIPIAVLLGFVSL